MDPEPPGRRGGQRKYSDFGIETALTLRLVLHLPHSQTEGSGSRSSVSCLDLTLLITHLSRWSRALNTQLKEARHRPDSLGLVIDSSGLAICGEEEWAAAKHGGKSIQGWRKLHFGVDETGTIVAQTLTEAHDDDTATGIVLMVQVHVKIKTVVADGTHDTRDFYAAAAQVGARAIIPRLRTAATGDPQARARHRTVRRVSKVGRRR